MNGTAAEEKEGSNEKLETSTAGSGTSERPIHTE